MQMPSKKALATAAGVGVGSLGAAAGNPRPIEMNAAGGGTFNDGGGVLSNEKTGRSNTYSTTYQGGK
uniref:Uncharacterized protein n=1 Tax=Panagrolaimus superbus TaxID=310955 RepID=A0A914YAI9_9BILA